LELAKILIRLNVIREATPTGTTGGSNVYVLFSHLFFPHSFSLKQTQSHFK